MSFVSTISMLHSEVSAQFLRRSCCDARLVARSHMGSIPDAGRSEAEDESGKCEALCGNRVD